MLAQEYYNAAFRYSVHILWARAITLCTTSSRPDIVVMLAQEYYNAAFRYSVHMTCNIVIACKRFDIMHNLLFGLKASLRSPDLQFRRQTRAQFPSVFFMILLFAKLEEFYTQPKIIHINSSCSFASPNRP
jgi:hypothetical protein